MNTNFSYALIGSGRLAHHLRHYLQLLQLPVRTWSRRESNRDYRQLDAVLTESSHVLLAVSDAAIQELAGHMEPRHVAVHFSGALNVPGAIAVHPLMTFGTGLHDLDWYARVPLVIDRGQDPGLCLPGWPNPFFPIDPALRPYYHALCALAGNSVFLLWQNIADELQSRCGLPREIIAPYLHQVVANLDERDNLTGPVARGDWRRTAEHLRALAARPDLRDFYVGFLKQAKAEGLNVPGELL